MSRKNALIGILINILSFYLIHFAITRIPTFNVETKEYWVEAVRNSHRVLFYYLGIILMYQKHILGKYLDVFLAIMIVIGFKLVDVIFFSASIQLSELVQILLGGSITLCLVSMFHKYLFRVQKPSLS